MCNRYRMTASQFELRRAFEPDLVVEPPTLPPTELFPRRPAWIVRSDGGRRVFDVMTWGFPPPMAASAPVTNVRNLASPFWRTALNRPDRRCLVPVTDFCEWEGEKGTKIARWFSVPSRAVFAFAGVWRPIADAGGACAFLTCEPNLIVAPVRSPTPHARKLF